MHDQPPRRPYPFHVFLTPTVPILAFVSADAALVTPRVLFWVCTAIIVAILVWSVLRIASRGDSRAAALAASALSLMIFDQATFTQLASTAGVSVLLLNGLLLFIAYHLLVLRRATDALTVFANAFMGVSTLLVTWPLASNHVARWSERAPEPTPLFQAAVQRDERPPDVYILVLDGYGRADVLRDYYGFENPLVADLESIGFYVAPQAASNYAQTTQSLASGLNLDYLDTLLGTTRAGGMARYIFSDMIASNRTLAALRAAGYRERFYASEYTLVKPGPHSNAHGRGFHFTELEYSLYGATILPLVSAFAGQPRDWLPIAAHRSHIRWTLDDLEHQLPLANDPPTVVFAHLLIPHPPFVFEPDGRPLASRLPGTLNDGSHWHAQAAGSGEQYQTGYIKGVQFLNSRLVQIVRRVLDRSDGRRAIFYLQADHGPASRLNWDDPNQTDFRERLGILLAGRFPDGEDTPLYPTITPVNALRIILNAALGTDLPLLADRAYFSPWRDPLHFIDVTDQVH